MTQGVVRCPIPIFVDDGWPFGQCQRPRGHAGSCDVYDGRDDSTYEPAPARSASEPRTPKEDEDMPKPYRVTIDRARPTARMLRGPVPNQTNPTDFDVDLELVDGRRAEGEVTLVFVDGGWYPCQVIATVGDADTCGWIHGLPLRHLLFKLPKAEQDAIIAELGKGPP